MREISSRRREDASYIFELKQSLLIVGAKEVRNKIRGVLSENYENLFSYPDCHEVVYQQVLP